MCVAAVVNYAHAGGSGPGCAQGTAPQGASGPGHLDERSQKQSRSEHASVAKAEGARAKTFADVSVCTVCIKLEARSRGPLCTQISWRERNFTDYVHKALTRYSHRLLICAYVCTLSGQAHRQISWIVESGHPAARRRHASSIRKECHDRVLAAPLPTRAVRRRWSQSLSA